MPSARPGAEPQSAAAVLMIRPRRFASNPETLASNRFQTPGGSDAAAVAAAAEREFDALAVALAAHGVRVHAFAGSREQALPDEVFPNNWLSCHGDGTVVLYPLLAPSRRRERRTELLDALRVLGYRIERLLGLAGFENRGLFLEGTGSLVLDRVQRIAYACRSPRTAAEPLAAFAAALGYEVVIFDALDRGGAPIYHTNVLMAVGTSFAVLCGAAFPDREQLRAVTRRLEESGREVIDLGFEQLHAFAGNLLELATPHGPIAALSTQALASLTAAQRAALAAHAPLVAADIATIERYGGGSVRCMLAEVFLPAA